MLEDKNEQDVEQKDVTENEESIFSNIYIKICCIVTILFCLTPLIIESCEYYFTEIMNFILGFLLLCIIIFAYNFLMPRIKNIVVFTGRKVLDFVTITDLLTSIIIAIIGLFVSYETQTNAYLGYYILGAFVFCILTLLKNYVLYLIIDIRDNLKIITDKHKEQVQNK